MLAVLVGAAVLFAQQIDEELALLGMFFVEPDGKRDLAWLGIEIVHNSTQLLRQSSHHNLPTLGPLVAMMNGTSSIRKPETPS
jgi:hypothetical protein